MIDRVFAFESTRVRQRAAPLLEEREAFLTYLFDRQVSIAHLKSIAATMIQIIRVMKLDSLRFVAPCEIEDAAQRWCEDECRVRGKHPKSAYNFTSVAMRWFRYAGVISPTFEVKSQGEVLIHSFFRYRTIERGYSEVATRCNRDRLSKFFLWVKDKQTVFEKIGASDVNGYLKHCQQLGYKPRTLNGICCALRAFFRYTALLGFDTSMIVRSIKYHRVTRYDVKPKGPEWRDVRHLLDHGFGETPSELRAAAIVSLAAIYALRRCEIARLKISDIDWESETIIIRRGKSAKIQQFPLQFEVGEKILNYLRDGRARCASRHLFVALRPPYQPLEPSITWGMVSRRLVRFGIPSENLGLHALRHSCATKLLRDGSSLKEVAAFLGHADMCSVSIYAKFDVKTLEQVATLSLAGIL
jgi:site-specific recombinase XerD